MKQAAFCRGVNDWGCWVELRSGPNSCSKQRQKENYQGTGLYGADTDFGQQ